MTKTLFKAVPTPQTVGYRVVRRRKRAFLYSAVTDHLYPLSARAAEVFEQTGLDAGKLCELERTCSDTGCRPAPAPPDPVAARAEVRHSLDREVQQIVLGVTENCNLRCRYCVYSGNYTRVRTHSNARMPWHVAREAIDYLLRHRAESPVPPGIAFYGGEPLVELSLIRRCVEYAEARSDGEVRFVITTNGTLLNERARALLVQYDFTLIVSLDGPPEVHDRYRRGAGGRPTFECIAANLRALEQEAPGYFRDRVRYSVVLAPPVDYGALGAFFDKFGAPCVVSPMEIYGASDEWHERLRRPDFEPLATAFEQACRDGKEAAGADLWRRFSVGLLGPALRRIQTRADRPDAAYYRLGQCIPGARKIFVNPRGDMYPCEKVEGGADVCIGRVDTGVDAEAVERLLTRFTQIVTDRCAACWMRRMCSACLADAVHGGCFDLRKMRGRCAARREAQAEVVGLYAALLEDDPAALNFLPEAFPWG